MMYQYFSQLGSIFLGGYLGKGIELILVVEMVMLVKVLLVQGN
jgi:hypothetical protein